jgi:predicted metal-dependent enzyme (double-stranded beta helix superfamily)
VSPDDDLRLLVHLDDEEGQGLVTLIFAPTQEDPPELLSVYGVIGLLKVDEGCIVPPLLALTRVDLG